MNHDPRTRKRRTRADSSVDQSLFQLSSNELILNPTETRRLRRRKPLVSEDQTHFAQEATSEKIAESVAESPETDNSDPDFIVTNPPSNPSLSNTVAQIKAELTEENRFALDSEYWNETHDWGHEFSSDYWHFLGQYE